MFNEILAAIIKLIVAADLKPPKRQPNDIQLLQNERATEYQNKYKPPKQARRPRMGNPRGY